MNVKIKKLRDDAVVPVYAKPGDSGFDLVAIETVVINPGQTAKVPTGIAVEIPDGYELQIRPRSGVSLKTKLRVQLGTIDSSYRGELGIVVDNNEATSGYHERMTNGYFGVDGEFHQDSTDLPVGIYVINKGDKVAQGVITPVIRASFEVVGDLSDTERGAGGFGHTGVSV